MTVAKIYYGDAISGPCLIVPFDDVPRAIRNNDDVETGTVYTIEVEEWTQEELDALPEFGGW